LCLKTPGVSRLSIRQLEKNKILILMIRPSIPSLNPQEKVKKKSLKACSPTTLAVVSKTLSSPKAKSNTHLTLGISSHLVISLVKLTGVTKTAKTTCPGPRTNTSLNIVGHAGHKAPPPLSLTDSTS